MQYVNYMATTCGLRISVDEGGVTGIGKVI
jgi:hypothetical protein